jgi:hypothetical protein
MRRSVRVAQDDMRGFLLKEEEGVRTKNEPQSGAGGSEVPKAA